MISERNFLDLPYSLRRLEAMVNFKRQLDEVPEEDKLKGEIEKAVEAGTLQLMKEISDQRVIAKPDPQQTTKKTILRRLNTGPIVPEIDLPN